jgi:hypothetical protein
MKKLFILFFFVVSTITTSVLFGQLSENFQSWTSQTSYLTTQSTQLGNGGNWLYTRTIVAPGGAANGTGSVGYTQLQKAGGELITPVISSGGVGTLTLKIRVSSSNGGFALYKRVNGGTWEVVNGYTTSATTTITSDIVINDNRPNLQLRILNNNANRALYIHDFITTVGPTAPSNDEPTGATTLTINNSLGYVTYTNLYATSTDTESTPSCALYNGADVWFKVVVPNNITILEFDTQTDGITDGGMTLYRGSIGSLTEIECDDDDGLDGLMPYIYREDFTPGETIYIRVWEYDGAVNGTGTFKIFVSTPQALPVELLYFEGVRYPTFNNLKWATASEQNSSHFDIERSENGENWRVIGTKSSASNSQSLINYSYLDYYNQDNTVYYRLVQYDIDGQYDIYGPISIEGFFSSKKIVRYINLAGQEVNETFKGVVLEVYEDGTMRKTIR